MTFQRLAPAALGLMALVAVASPGCSCGGDTESAGPTTSSTTTTSTSASVGAGGAGGGSGAGGSGGAGGGASAENGPPATETVSAGEVIKSGKYKMVFTLGQPTQNQGKSTSPAYRIQGGVIGANGSLP